MDVHTAFRFLNAAHAGALLAFGMMVLVAPGFWQNLARNPTAKPPPWGWLGLFALVKTLSVGGPLSLGMIERTLPMETFRVIYMVAAGIAWTFALEFGRRWWGLGSAGWRMLPVVAVSMWAGPLLGRQWSFADHGLAWGAAVPAVILVLGAAWKAIQRGDIRHRPLVFAVGAVALVGLGLFEIYGFAYSDWFQGWTANTFTWFEDPAPIVPVATGLSLVLLGAWSWWMLAQLSSTLAGSKFSRVGMATVIGPAVGILFLSTFVVWWLDRAGTRQNTSIRPTVYATVRGVAAQLDPILREVASQQILLDGDWGRKVRARLASEDVIRALPGTEGFVLWAVQAGNVSSLLRVPEDLPAIPRRPMNNPNLLIKPHAVFPVFTLRNSPFTPPAMLDEISMHVLHSVPLGVRLPTGESVWLGLRQNFASWDGYKREIYVQGIFSLMLVGIVGGIFVIFVLRLRREQELQLARDRAQAASDAKSEFIAFVSHELRTPLQSVIGYADILRRRPDHPARREFLESLALQGRNLLDVVNHLLDFSAAEAGSLALNTSTFPLCEVVDDCARTVAPELEAKGLSWRVSIDPAVRGEVTGDRARVRQVLLNVIGNAVKFADRGGVSVEVDSAPPQTAAAGRTPASSAAPLIRFTVTDTGPGIPEVERGRLFEVFARLQDKVKGGKSGSGIGLALSRKLCGLMGGTITLENRSDGIPGAVATVVLPLGSVREIRGPLPEQGQTGSSMPCASQSFLDLGQKSPARILLAEDHPYVREVLCEMLSGLGCILDTIDNGVEAIELGCNGAYDIIFLDMWMPGRSGTDVAREIRTAVPAAARPWLVGISASSRPEDREACLAAGMNDFLPKPVDQAALQAALRRAGWLTAPPDRIPSAENGSSVGIVSSRKWRSKFGANFEEEMRVLVEVIARGVEAGEWSLVHERTHYLENSALCVGRSDVAAACAKLVGAARARTSELSAAALASLRNAALHGRSGEVSS